MEEEEEEEVKNKSRREKEIRTRNLIANFPLELYHLIKYII